MTTPEPADGAVDLDTLESFGLQWVSAGIWADVVAELRGARAALDVARAREARADALIAEVQVVAADLLDRRDALDTGTGNRDYKRGQRMGYEDAARFIRRVLTGDSAFTLVVQAEQRAAYFAALDES